MNVTPITVQSSINWNDYYTLDKYFLLLPYESNRMYKYAKIIHQIGMNDSAFLEIVDIKTFYGNKLSDFIAFATIGHESSFLKSVLAETYFKGYEHKKTLVETTLWAMIFVKTV